jgi:hypothetical protein
MLLQMYERWEQGSSDPMEPHNGPVKELVQRMCPKRASEWRLFFNKCIPALMAERHCSEVDAVQVVEDHRREGTEPSGKEVTVYQIVKHYLSIHRTK